MNSKKLLRGSIIWIVVVLVVVYFGMRLLGGGSPQEIDTSAGLELLAGDTVEQVEMTDGYQRVDLTLTKDFKVGGEDKGKLVRFYYTAPQGPAVVEAVTKADPPKGYNSVVPQSPWWSSLLMTMLSVLLLVGVFWFLMSRMQGGNSKMMNFGKSKAKQVSKETPTATFADVAGVEEAVEELGEIKEFLTEPARFQAVGAKVPKGVLLYGPPGTGKTLLARAVAGEAGAPFYSISGSDFVEMFVGVGASRVRDLFEQAKANAPAIIFIDEIDAVGRHRGAGLGGGHDEREQTLNQMLVEMDGFDATTNVIMIAATNRPDILDPALLRPGRFDRQVAVEAPDLKGREAILAVHAKGKPMAPDVDMHTVAKRTPGFTGADLANVLNEAAILTARSGRPVVSNGDLDEAIDRVIAGPQKKTRVMNEKERKITAYHEGGHALVAAALRYTDPVTKVTILPRGRALGYTMVMPAEDKYSVTRNELLDQLAYAMGGRVAEELVFHDPTTGASNDIEKATATARKMIKEYGMSERVGAIRLGQADGEVFLGRDMGHQREYSEEIAGLVDEESRRLIESAHDEAWEILTTYRAVLDDLALELLERETLNEQELAEVFAPIVKRDARPVWLSSQSRGVSDIPPVRSSKEIAAGDAPMLPQDEAAAAGEIDEPTQRPPSPQAPHPGGGGLTPPHPDEDQGQE
ncbi:MULTISPECIES: ATP-dependent zinc metalloprotease FtsH [unclassified Pseudactinotalea]|uniref:ATP-dependent zinc metalloprotease FtsH n=1 Tax=unclassified Pseudactinotalea TaxID=2649176 RepID=UPI00128E2534|nr:MULTISPECIES: ATP-dependent zinc metalloprotease FtsH [unclassified Pseudactinotalea]MPV48427.1 ATP-dependent zinc metalloprotease FtsH [Pseudactinotalea sp. HY160]QGH68407.1 ATP-dependent zinc metalloprotease FtsH [Pseudactinotalea sp. HY158]